MLKKNLIKKISKFRKVEIQQIKSIIIFIAIKIMNYKFRTKYKRHNKLNKKRMMLGLKQTLKKMMKLLIN